MGKRLIESDVDTVPDFEEGEEAHPFAETEISEDETEQHPEALPEKKSSFFANPFGKSTAGTSKGVAQGELELGR